MIQVNTELWFFPTLELIDPAPDTEVLYNISLSLSTFNEQRAEKIKENETLSGTIRRKVFSATKQYSCVSIPDETEGRTEEMNMFFASVRSGNTFYMTNMDEDDRLMSVILMGKPSKNRSSPRGVNVFGWNFNVREVI